MTRAKLYAVIGDYEVDGEAWFSPKTSVRIYAFRDIRLVDGLIDQSEREAAWHEMDAILKANVLPFITPELVKKCWTIAKINGYVMARQEMLRSWNALKNADPDLVEELCGNE